MQDAYQLDKPVADKPDKPVINQDFVLVGVKYMAFDTDPREMSEVIKRLPLDLQEAAARSYVDMRKFLGKPASFSV